MCLRQWRNENSVSCWHASLLSLRELELDLIQTQMTQKPMLRAEVYARALRASQTRKEDSVSFLSPPVRLLIPDPRYLSQNSLQEPRLISTAVRRCSPVIELVLVIRSVHKFVREISCYENLLCNVSLAT